MTIRFEEIATDNWKISLPSDWEDKSSEDCQGFYFESSDERQGFYISAWKFDDQQFNGSNLSAVKEFSELEIEEFEGMDEYKWKVLSSVVTDNGDKATSILDYYDKNRKYRIVCKINAKLPLVVRTSFHDYDCESVSVSDVITEKVINSIIIA